MIQPFNPNQLARQETPEFDDGVAQVNPLSEQDYQDFKQGFTDWKWLLFVKFLRATGVRVSEALNLEARYCQLAGPDYKVWVKRGKQQSGEKVSYSQIYLPPEYGLELRNWIAGNGITPASPVFFSTKPGKKMVRSTVWYAFQKAGLATIGRAVGPHEFRKLFVSSLANQGVPMAAVAKLVGHISSKTTEEYYHDLNDAQRRQLGESIQL